MPPIPVTTPISYIGVFFIITGLFLIVAGLNIIKVEKVIVKTGKTTWGAGLLLVIIGILFLLPEITPTLSKNLPQDTVIAPTPVSEIIFQDNFDSNINGWDIEKHFYDNYSVDINIENGKLYRIMQTTEKSNGSFGSTAIPKVSQKNFCLEFETKLVEATNNTAVDIVLRATNYYDLEVRGFYYLRLFQQGSGVIRLNPPGNGDIQQIRTLESVS